jgi:hypothetical protein
MGWVQKQSGGFTYGKYKGSLTFTATEQAVGVYRITHNAGNTNYVVFFQLEPSFGVTNIQLNAIIRASNYFDIYVAQQGIAANGSFYFKMETTN